MGRRAVPFARVLSGLLVAVVATAGCFGPAGQESDAAERTSRPVWSSDAANWSSFQFSYQGQAGDFAAFHQPLAPTNRIAYTLDVDVRFEGPVDPGAALFVVPFGFLSGDGFQDDPYSPFDSPTVLRPTELDPAPSISESRTGSRSSGRSITGVWMAAVANAPWSMSVSFVDEGSAGPALSRPAFVASGSGARLSIVDQMAETLPGGPAASLVLEESIATAGWTHLQLVFDPLQPIGVRSHSYQVPNGTARDGVAYAAGYDVVVSGQASTFRVDYVGHFQSTPGTARAEVTLAEADLSTALALVHFPTGPVWPMNATAGEYAGSVWPFGDGPL